MEASTTSLGKQRLTITPLKPIDQVKPANKIRSIVFCIVRAAVDEQLLEDSLRHLIQNHLPILGARIKSASKGGVLVYELPVPFPDNYPLFHWSSQVVESSFDESKLLPPKEQRTGIIAWDRSLPELELSWTPADWPREHEVNTGDMPLLLVHVTHYTDATVLSTNIPHAVCDQAGYGSILKAWLQVVRGRGRHPSLPTGKPYLHNALAFSLAHLAVCRATPLVDIACENRLALTKVLSPLEMDRCLAVTRETFKRGYQLMPCEAGELLFSVTNWCMAWREVDFTYAIESKSASDEHIAISSSPGSSRSEVSSNSSQATQNRNVGEVAPEPLILGIALDRTQAIQRCELHTILKLLPSRVKLLTIY
ncbi:hypothetical protein ACJZ2D_010338 [Fusarium nematophilum]